jgi:hypothetical protein
MQGCRGPGASGRCIRNHCAFRFCVATVWRQTAGTPVALTLPYQSFHPWCHVKTEVNRLDEEMTELSLLLPSEQALALIAVAQSEGVSVAQFMRRLVLQALDVASPPTFSLN